MTPRAGRRRPARTAGLRPVLLASLALSALLASLPGVTASAAAASPPVAAPVRPPAAPAGGVKVPPRSTGQWWFDTWRVGDLWAAGATGRGVTVAVMDTGVNPKRPELAGRVLRGNDFFGGPNWSDGDILAHGSGMAVLIAGGGGGSSSLTGVTPEARILPIMFNMRTVESGLRWAVDHGAKVINISAGWAGTCSDLTVDALRYVVDHGGVVVTAAGNDGDKPRVSQFPASCPGVLAVGAVDPSRRVWRRSSPGPWLDVAAPGDGVPHLDVRGRPYLGAGTSDASALTSAAIAAVWSRYPELTNRQVVARILATLKDDATRRGRDDWAGAGVVRPYEAVTAKVPPDAPNPVFDELDRVRPPGTVPSSPDSSADPAASPSAGGAAAVPTVRPASEGRPGSSVRPDEGPRSGWRRELLLGLGAVGVGVLLLMLLVVVVLRRRAAR